MVPRAVLLVDEDWVANFVKDDILKMNTGSGGGASRRWPCLDPQPVVSSLEGAVYNLNVVDILLPSVSSKASHTDSVSRTAHNFFNEEILHPISHGDAVISCGDLSVEDLDSLTSSQMDTVSVGAFSWSDDLDVIKGHVLAADNVEVEIFGI